MLLHFTLSFLLVIPIMFVWAHLAEAFGWSFFTGWGMIHGGFAIAMPVSWLLSFGLLCLVPKIRNSWRS